MIFTINNILHRLHWLYIYIYNIIYIHTLSAFGSSFNLPSCWNLFFFCAFLVCFRIWAEFGVLGFKRHWRYLCALISNCFAYLFNYRAKIWDMEIILATVVLGILLAVFIVLPRLRSKSGELFSWFCMGFC